MFDFEDLPPPSDRRIALGVKPAAERALRSGHPWLFDQAIRSQSHEGAPGDLAVIFDKKRRFLAVGLYDPDSPIRVKVLQHRHPATINGDWFQAKLHAAAQLRAPLNTESTNAYRLVHGENDGLPGLIVDRYADTLVIKLYTAAWIPHLRALIPALSAVQNHTRLVLRLSRAMSDAAAHLGLGGGQILRGTIPEGPVAFIENGLHFAADVVQGHKTGFFFDQRENRARVRDFARGRHVLDVFAYSGGFSLYAAAGGAQSVTSLDISAPALAAASANFKLNQGHTQVAAAEHRVLVDDAFDGLRKLADSGQHFTLVIVDPPSFAKSADEIDSALAAYERLTYAALDVLAPEGLLVMASCSSRVSAERFFDTVLRAAQGARRPLKEIERTGHALDHPVGFPEGVYLKCLFAASIR